MLFIDTASTGYSFDRNACWTGVGKIICYLLNKSYLLDIINNQNIFKTVLKIDITFSYFNGVPGVFFFFFFSFALECICGESHLYFDHFFKVPNIGTTYCSLYMAFPLSEYKNIDSW